LYASTKQSVKPDCFSCQYRLIAPLGVVRARPQISGVGQLGRSRGGEASHRPCRSGLPVYAMRTVGFRRSRAHPIPSETDDLRVAHIAVKGATKESVEPGPSTRPRTVREIRQIRSLSAHADARIVTERVGAVGRNLKSLSVWVRKVRRLAERGQAAFR